jgi:hypothetical protein
LRPEVPPDELGLRAALEHEGGSTTLEGSGGARTSLEIDEEEAPPSPQWWSGCGDSKPLLHFMGYPADPMSRPTLTQDFSGSIQEFFFHFVSLFWVVGYWVVNLHPDLGVVTGLVRRSRAHGVAEFNPLASGSGRPHRLLLLQTFFFAFAVDHRRGGHGRPATFEGPSIAASPAQPTIIRLSSLL